ncbi:MAG: hypothetical protein RL376_573, partial [Verrucomicrobiota bacterium]
YEGRTGNPYSYVYSTDLNGDGQSNNDRVAVPSGAADARFNFSGLSATQLDTYLANFRKTDLNEYAGGVAPKNAFREPFVNRLDLKLSQQIPVHRSLRSELFLDFINFGTFLSEDLFNYREQANLLSNDVFRRRTIGGASYGSDGRIVVSPSNVTAPSSLVIDNTQSRWRIQVGARITF